MRASCRHAWILLAASSICCSSAWAAETLKEPVFSAPANFVESAPEGPFPCRKGLNSQITLADYRRFALRNQIWPQETGVDLSRTSWSAGYIVQMPRLDFGFAGKEGRRFKADVHVLVSGEGLVLDKVVTCTTAPAHNAALLALVDGYRFEPSRYKGRGLNTVIPLELGN